MKTGKVSDAATGFQLTREALAKTRRKALRQRCWYKALNGLERGIVELAIRCVEEVKSIKLKTALRKILAKLVSAFRPRYLDMAEKMGRPLAVRVSQLAQSWGNKLASKWKDDAAFTRYLGFTALGVDISRSIDLPMVGR